jgi:hypothetical protein
MARTAYFNSAARAVSITTGGPRALPDALQHVPSVHPAHGDDCPGLPHYAWNGERRPRALR